MLGSAFAVAVSHVNGMFSESGFNVGMIEGSTDVIEGAGFEGGV